MVAKRKTTKKADEVPVELQVLEIRRGVIECCLLGETPLVYNSVSAKARQELLLPRAKAVSSAERKERERRPKHQPVEEFRNSVYALSDEDAPTYLSGPAEWFKKSICQAALRIPGATKTEIGQLVTVLGHHMPIYGVPKLWMARVTMAGPSRAPDIRTRAILPRWATRLSIRFIKPLLTEQTVVNLLATAGMICGVGDNRQEKGSGNCGLWRIVEETDETYLEVLEEGREAQRAAMETPVCYDESTESLMSWYDEEIARRERVGKQDTQPTEITSAPDGVM